MNVYVSVIVSKCVDDRIFGDRLIDTSFPSVGRARVIGNQYRAKGACVILRPNYNETDADGRFFREWRSFNGEPFKEVRFGF